MIAPHHGKHPPRIGEFTFLDVLHPGAIDANRNLVLAFAGHGTGVAPDALGLVEHLDIAHAAVGQALDAGGHEGRALRAADTLKALNVPSDFDYSQTDNDQKIEFVHRKLADGRNGDFARST